MDNKELLKHIVDAIEDVKVENIKIYETKEVNPLFDYAVIATAKTSRQMNAVVEHLEKKGVENGFTIRGIEGVRGGYWALIDLNDVIVNIFIAEERDKYDLDRRWMHLPQIDSNDL